MERILLRQKKYTHLILLKMANIEKIVGKFSIHSIETTKTRIKKTFAHKITVIIIMKITIFLETNNTIDNILKLIFEDRQNTNRVFSSIYYRKNIWQRNFRKLQVLNIARRILNKYNNRKSHRCKFTSGEFVKLREPEYTIDR